MSERAPARGGPRLCLTGDVMVGRGIDQILAHPGDPTIHEQWVRTALRYVEIAEDRSGPIPRRVEPPYIWGDALEALENTPPDAFVVNLETAVTDCGEPWPGKGIQYRMNPLNVDCLTAAGVDVAVLANNHVLDWSEPGLTQTVAVLGDAGIATAGAGADEAAAWRPAMVDLSPTGRVLVLGLASTSSGVPASWAAAAGRAGVALLADLSEATVDRVAAVVDRHAEPGDVVVASVHWGPNWGYEIPENHRRFAHALVERGGVHVVHGHSSHHPLGLEVHRDRLVLYGCGDLLTDYEGISGHESYRGELSGLYLPTIDAATGELTSLEIVPTKVERFRLTRPADEDARWLAALLDRESSPLGASVALGDHGRLTVDW